MQDHLSNRIKHSLTISSSKHWTMALCIWYLRESYSVPWNRLPYYRTISQVETSEYKIWRCGNALLSLKALKR